MLKFEISIPSPDPSFPPTLADLSRNASVISSSSSDSAPSLFLQPTRPRPPRQFSAPRSMSPHVPSPRSPRGSKPPSYLAKELGLSDNNPEDFNIAAARARSRSRNPATRGRYSAQDFVFGETLGEGSYSTVMRGTHLPTGQQYAIKILDKNHLIRNNKVQTAMAEKDALVRLGPGHPGIVRFFCEFQDDWSYYIVIDLATNGELQSRISRLGSLSTQCAQYYGAQIVDAVEYMHSKGVIHRDLKPENLLLDDDFRIKITDFGTGKILESGDKAKTYVGTAQYVSPELLEASETSKSTDLWSIGCIIYQMIAGRFAFQGLTDYLTYQKIKRLEYTFPEGFDEQAKDLVEKLLIRNPIERLGAGPPGSRNDMQTLRSHPFFSTINWRTLWTDLMPPLEPGLVKREHILASSHDHDWEDIGAAWDELVGDDQDDDQDDDLDEIRWASDAEGPDYTTKKRYKNSKGSRFEEIGPIGEIRRYPRNTEEVKKVRYANEVENAGGDFVAQNCLPAESVTVTEPASVAGVLSDPDSIGSASSSSEGSPVKKLDAALEAVEPFSAGLSARHLSTDIALVSTPIRPTPACTGSELDSRGRNRALTPVQGNGPVFDYDISALLLPSETILFKSTVEAKTIRRRASRLIPIPIHPIKTKTRQLVLTSHRLLCLKQQMKGQRSMSVKAELGLQASDKKEKQKEKESRSIVSSIELKGDREFVVLTSTKAHVFSASNPLAWFEKINRALETRGQRTSKSGG